MKNRVYGVLLLVLMLSSIAYIYAFWHFKSVDKVKSVYAGMLKNVFDDIYPSRAARTSRLEGADEWITFNEPFDKVDQNMVTFHFYKGRLKDWRLDDRAEVIEEYLGEFCSQGIVQGMPKIHTALKNVLRGMSLKDFLQVTDRQRPVLFTEYYYTGTARFANTSEIIASEDDAPAFEKGITIIKLGDALNEAETSAPIEGVLAHELAHRVLDHVKKGRVTCTEEREANALIKQWGFADQFAKASKLFGRKAGDPASCQEEQKSN